LRPLMVVNPYARELTFVDRQTRSRRDHTKYLGLIRTIALLHQYQRPVKRVSHGGEVVEYVEVTLEDLSLANLLADQVLGRSLDELPPQTRRVLVALDEMVAEACASQGIERSAYRFTKRALRERMGLGHTQLKLHLGRLEELEYVLAHPGGRGQSVAYELLYDGKGKDGAPFLTGLIDLEKLTGQLYDAGRWSAISRGWSGKKAGWSGGGRPVVGPESGGGRGGAISISPNDDRLASAIAAQPPRNAHLGNGAARPSSYPQA
jgi:DNA primase